jgi:hypothetical protein
MLFLFGCNQKENNSEEINYSNIGIDPRPQYGVFIPLDTKTTTSGKGVEYGIGIIKENDSYFSIKMALEGIFISEKEPEKSYKLYCNEGNCNIEGSSEDSIQYLISRNGEIKIYKDKEDVTILAVLPSKNSQKGHYVFKLLICSDNDSYPTCTNENLYGVVPYKIHLIVK